MHLFSRENKDELVGEGVVFVSEYFGQCVKPRTRTFISWQAIQLYTCDTVCGILIIDIMK